MKNIEKINEVIPYLKKCKFCVGNDTGFAHLSVNLDIETLVIQGGCPPQSYSKLLKHVDIERDVTRSPTSIHSIKIEKILDELSKLLNRRGGRVVEGARLESVCTLTGTVGSNPTLSAINLTFHCI